MGILIAMLAILGWGAILLRFSAQRDLDQRQAREEQSKLQSPDVTQSWPALAVIIPAREEEAVIHDSLISLMAQDYPSPWHVVLVDDHSSDGTVEAALRAAEEMGAKDHMTVVQAPTLPPGWRGKTWAMETGWRYVQQAFPDVEFILFTDADIAHAPDGSGLRRLVRAAVDKKLDLVSRLVRFPVEHWAERLILPAYVFFFRLLYPFHHINDPGDKASGAAGGIMLIRRAMMEKLHGLSLIGHELIDDCALAFAVKAEGGRLQLALDSAGSTSIRRFDSLSGLRNMITRSAFDQLHYSWGHLALAMLAMAALCLAPPLLFLLNGGWLPTLVGAALFGGTWFGLRKLHEMKRPLPTNAEPFVYGLAALLVLVVLIQSGVGLAGYLGLAAWIGAAIAYRWGAPGYFGTDMGPFSFLPLGEMSLPAASAVFMAATLESAWRHRNNQPVKWKGRETKI